MKTKIAALLNFFLSLIPSTIAFFLAYFYTDKLFQAELFPFPFELFGIAAGLGVACWVYAFVSLIRKITRTAAKPKVSPYTVSEKTNNQQVGALK